MVVELSLSGLAADVRMISAAYAASIGQFEDDCG